MIEYFLKPLRHDGLGALVGGTAIIFIGELLEQFGGTAIGYYGAIPGFLIKIGAISLCFGYSSQVLKAAYLNAKEMPYWEISSLDFVGVLEKLLSVFVSLIYAFIFSLIFYFISILFGGVKTNVNLFLLLTHLDKYGFWIFFSVFFPAIYFWHSLYPDDWSNLLNPAFIFIIIVKSLPMYVLLGAFSYFIIILFLFFRIKIAIIGSFVTWFIKFYFLILFSIIVGNTFKKLLKEANYD